MQVRALPLNLVLAVVGLGCGPSHGTVHFLRPNGGGGISISFPQLNEHRRIQITYGDREMFMVFAEPAITAIGLAEVAWMDDLGQVAILVCGASTPIIAYDRAKHAQATVDDRHRKALGVEVRQHFSVPVEDDPLSWACNEQGRREFWARHFGNR